ncbi:DUF4236 domain-containing protein [Priestia aryabhattai]|uniref:DUF4236 domain-containing protein n=1 Tax=Priestia aryabhattai TaxID=412384 RepID=UPI002E24313F|nr:DUF4236 domain-containing protein [Priestia aryabhattai]
MGFRYKKSINLGGGVRLNAGKKGIGISAGTKGLRISHGADGKTRVTASIPGTGISYQETVGLKKQKPTTEGYNPYEPSTHMLYEFTGTVRNKIEDGERATLSVLLNQPSTVSFYKGETHITTHNPELGGDKMYYSINEIQIEKNIREGRFLFKKYRDIEIRLIFESGSSTEYTLLVKDESVADSLINWYTSYKETMEPQIFDNDLYDEEEDVLELTCTNCFTNDIVEDWQIREDDNCWWVYCQHCSEEFEVGASEDGEETMNDIHEADMLPQCPNPECIGEIPLYESDFDEEDTAIVQCPYCFEQITFNR